MSLKQRELARQVPSSPSDLLCVSPISQFLNGAAGNKRTRQQVLKDLAKINIAPHTSQPAEEEDAMKKFRLDASKEEEQQPKCQPVSAKRAVLAPRPVNITTNSTATKKKKFVHSHHSHTRRSRVAEETTNQ